MKEYKIYNLEFPKKVNELKIGKYNFTKFKNYDENYKNLQHLVTVNDNGEETKKNTGSHQVTASVKTPNTEKKSILPWLKKSTELEDIILLLSIFTGRDVFVKNWKENQPIIADSRIYQFGGELILSLDRDHTKFEENINKVFETISAKKWQNEYENGYFLIIYNDAMKRQSLENSFILSWTIWEHIFSVKNKGWLSTNELEKTFSINKIFYILNYFFKKKINKTAKKQINKLIKTRNRIIHFGKVYPNTDKKEIILFIRLTEQLIALILNLETTEVFIDAKKLDDFLKGKK